jgi:DtxR family transcriptional regulator, Mn-dependent transcriptional regulator
MQEILTDSIQDYLKSIYDLTQNGQPASTTSLALRLGIKPASVTGMLQKLATLKPPLVNYHKHQGVKLTPKGRRAALEIIRHHRLLESWLVQTLGYSWDEVHNEAEKLEHAISEDFEKRIATALGFPIRDPHGDLIPSANLVMPKDESVLLSSLESEQEATVRRIDAQDVGFLRHIEELGLIPGAPIKTLTVSPYDELMSIQIQDRKNSVILGPAITKRVFVEIL